MIYAFPTIGVLTVLLVLMNVHEVVLHFLRDRDRVRLSVYLGAILLLGSTLITVAYRVVDKVADGTAIVNAADKVSG